MQTFLPSPDYTETARILDYRRLGKQRVECKQILMAMNKNSGGWRNHPATKMWRGHEVELCQYAKAMCEEWIKRGYKDSLLPFFTAAHDQYVSDGRNETPPAWLGEDDVHASHRSNLLRKDPEYYGKFGWTEGAGLEYVWPVQ